MITHRSAIPILLVSLILGSCDQKAPESAPTAMKKHFTGSYTGHVVTKPFENKVGQVKGPDELYLRLSMGDFSVKFSESKVSANELRMRLNQVITVEGKIRHGEWDVGPNDPPGMQSRIGDYIAITKLLE